ncbi:MAG: ABC transporter ATP-binding protein [Ilumatobacteraceae bacterium]
MGVRLVPAEERRLMAAIIFDEVSKTFDDGTLAVDALSLEIRDGEFLVLVGPSGCGKTTSLRMLAGLDDPTAGRILIDGNEVNDIPSRRRDVAMVFQNYALYPHMSVADNLVFPLRMQGVDKSIRRARAEEVAAVLGLSELLDRRPKQLSGGQRQRVAMGRAIVRSPKAFLMDEPLSNLDAKLRVQMRAEISRIQRRLETTTVYVTHDQVEAMTMADRVAVMHRGVLQQLASPVELYDRPVNLFVAGFIGSPPMNLLNAVVERNGDRLAVSFGSHRLELPARHALADRVGRSVVLGIRPEDIEDVSFRTEAPAGERIRAEVDLVEQLGSEMVVHLLTDAEAAVSAQITEAVETDDAPARGTGVRLVARCNPRSRVRRSDTAEFAVAVDRLHLFDPTSGLRLDA